MRTKALFLGAMALVAVMVAFGAFRESTSTSADLTKPIQPFYADLSLAGFSDTTLGATTPNYVYTHIPIGVRISIPWIYSGPGYITPSEAEGPGIGVSVGGIRTVLDVLCNGVRDYMVPSATDINTKYPWNETTTAAKGTDAEFLYAQVPPYPWIFRDTSNPNHFLLGGTTQISATVQLNTVYTVLPFSPNGASGTATTKNNGNPHTITTAETVCIDSPENTTSDTAVNTNPPKLNDSGGAHLALPAGGAAPNWADGVVTGPAGPFVVTGTTLAVPIKTNYFNRGPNGGNFSATWKADVLAFPAGSITATWSNALPKITVGQNLPAPGVNVPAQQPLDVTCGAGAAFGVVTVTNALWPVAPTLEMFWPDNNGISSILVVCPGAGTPTPVDKQVVRILPESVTGVLDPIPSPWEVNLLAGTTADFTISEVKANNTNIDPVPGHEWLYADVGNSPLSRNWVMPTGTATPITVAKAFATPAAPTPVADCSTADAACVTFPYSEPKGQSTVKAHLLVDCPPATTGRFSVLVTGADWPDGTTYVEAIPADNVARTTITVNCWASASDLTAAQAADGWDDGTGLYTRWTIFQSNPDARLTWASPPAFVSDDGMDTKGQNPSGGYIERTLDLECFWHDANGCALGTCDTVGINADGDPVAGSDGVIDAAESHQDPDLVALANTATGKTGYDAIDADHDCLIDQGITGTASKVYQPGHPVDLPSVGSPAACTFPYAAAPEQALNTYDRNTDHDCDGLPDGVEAAFGSNPLLDDSDADGAFDFQEMFQFTNPNSPDTDGDGFKDAPSGVFGDNTNHAQDNCPSVANPTQLNSDGKHRPSGIKIATGKSSNPNKDKLGDACDPDNDNDGSPDVVETFMGTGPLNPDTNGNHCVDGSEVYLGLNPATTGHNCPTTLTLDQVKFFRGCTWNEPPLGAYGGAWNNTYSGGVNAASRVELDPDGDGIKCTDDGTTVKDTDNDNGTGTLAAGAAEVSDIVETEGYNTNPALKDTDGDGCEDWVQINDVNGDGIVNVADTTLLAKRLAGVITSDPVSDLIFDVTKDNKYNVADSLQMAKNTCSLKPSGGCGTTCKTQVY